MQTTENKILVALAACGDYAQPRLRDTVFKVLSATDIHVDRGMRVLVKPNLLQAKELACTSHSVVAAVCEWLLEKGIRPMVADSPGFGHAETVARAIGIAEALAPLHLHVEALDDARPIRLKLPDGKTHIKMRISKKALDTDLIISVPRVKAHSQMRLTLGVKNCFGCVSSLRKAWCHAAYGRTTEFFADCLAALWAALPPVAEVADGIKAMHVTGPVKGEPFALGLIGASSSAPVLDSAIMKILGVKTENCPLAKALDRREAAGLNYFPSAEYPLAKPGDFQVSGFMVPQTLTPASFNPIRLGWSMVRRMLKSFR